MPAFKYTIELSEQDKAELRDIVTKGKSPARTILRANILLASDKGSEKYMTVSKNSRGLSYDAHNRANGKNFIL